MDMKRLIFLCALFAAFAANGAAQEADSVRHEVLFETTMGNIRVVLYNETPRHRDNFLKLVGEGFYDGNLFHRVIADFMIQTGDSTTRHAKPGETVGLHSPDYTVPAEIVFPKYFHKRGALAAAREGDAANPKGLLRPASSTSCMERITVRCRSTAFKNASTRLLAAR